MTKRTIRKLETAWGLMKGGASLALTARAVGMAPDCLDELLWRWWTPTSGRGPQ